MLHIHTARKFQPGYLSQTGVAYLRANTVEGPPRRKRKSQVPRRKGEISEFRAPRILLVTPEISYLPEAMGDVAPCVAAKAGGLADVSASLISALVSLGADIHVALPNYRRMFNGNIFHLHEGELRKYHEMLPNSRTHLAQDRIFYYRDRVYSRYDDEAMRIALVFQRELINHIIPAVNPDLVHCNDWMTGLIPAMARRRGIKSLFTIHNIHTRDVPLVSVEEYGIDAAEFWMHLFYNRLPANGYEEARSDLSVDLLTTGIFSAHCINAVSPRFLREVVDGHHPMVPESARAEIRNKHAAGCALGILNAPDPSYDPTTDPALVRTYGADDFLAGKLCNKQALQRRLGLVMDPAAPVFFWPSRLDPAQKGPELLTDILHRTVTDYHRHGLQIVVVADGPHQVWLHEIVSNFGLRNRVAVADFDEKLSRLAYAGADFMLMPSLFEPCGLPQMVAPIYGTLAIARDTGGIADTVHPLEVKTSTGNGFRFVHYDSNGLRWAVDQAMDFFARPLDIRVREIRRIMRESKIEFSHAQVARNYMACYEAMLACPLVAPGQKGRDPTSGRSIT
jgi:ADP-glucose type glycogen/starch synthase